MLSPLVWRLGWTLVHFLWQGLAIAILLALALRILRKHPPEARYAAGSAALVLLAVVPIATYLRLTFEQLSRQQAFDATIVSAAANHPVVVVVGHQPTGIENILPSFVGLWACGVAALSIRLLGGILVVERLKRRLSSPAPEEWQQRLNELAERIGLRRQVILRESARVAAPVAMGVFRAFVVLPASMLANLTPRQVEAILLHELAHIRRQDYLVNILQTLLETVLFYHPAVWWVSGVVRNEREHCCDDAAVRALGDPVLYARTLTRLEEYRGAMPKPSLSAKGGHLMNRIVRILSTRHPSSKVSPLWAGVAALTISACILGGTLEARAQGKNSSVHASRSKAKRIHKKSPQTVLAAKRSVVTVKPMISAPKKNGGTKPVIIVQPAGIAVTVPQTKNGNVIAVKSPTGAGQVVMTRTDPASSVPGTGFGGSVTAPGSGYGGGSFPRSGGGFGGGGGVFGGAPISATRPESSSDVLYDASFKNGAISYKGSTASFEVVISAVMRAADQSYVIGPDPILRPVSINLKSIPLDSAIKAICFAAKATYRVEGGVYYFVPLDSQDSYKGSSDTPKTAALKVHTTELNCSGTPAETLFAMLANSFATRITVQPGTYRTVSGKLQYAVLEGDPKSKETGIAEALDDACNRVGATWKLASAGNYEITPKA